MTVADGGVREPVAGEVYVALTGHLMERRERGPLHLAACACWRFGQPGDMSRWVDNEIAARNLASL